jgi:hypothetical protein
MSVNPRMYMLGVNWFILAWIVSHCIRRMLSEPMAWIYQYYINASMCYSWVVVGLMWLWSRLMRSLETICKWVIVYVRYLWHRWALILWIYRELTHTNLHQWYRVFSTVCMCSNAPHRSVRVGGTAPTLEYVITQTHAGCVYTSRVFMACSTIGLGGRVYELDTYWIYVYVCCVLHEIYIYI